MTPATPTTQDATRPAAGERAGPAEAASTDGPSATDGPRATDETAPKSEPAPAPAPPAASLPPDPAAYDSERAVHARARGLDAPYIAGGVDPDPVKGLEEERHYGRLLVLMIAIIVIGGFVLGFIGLIVGGGTT
jgi:hypothetical protein